MREGWTYKKLMDLCSVKTGKKDANHANDQGKYRFYTCAENYLMCNTHSFSGKCLILPGNGVNVGKVFKYDGLFEAYQRTYVIHNIKEDINYDFLYYVFLKKWKHIGVAQQYGSATNYIKIGNFESFIIGFPPLSEQERIVSELDILSSIIEKKKAQLKEYDQLAQSIFYDMFGDLVTNEKGWEVKKLGEVCAQKTKISRASKSFSSNSHIEYIDISSIDNNSKTITTTTSCIFSAAPSRAQQAVKYGDILISLVRPNLQNIAIVLCNENNLVASSGFCVIRAEQQTIKEYLFYVVRSSQFTQFLMQRVSGANYPAVREEDVKSYTLPLPPLSLQQSFAEKIEAIEKQKELIKQSIAETETLFNSRMDYYFN